MSESLIKLFLMSSNYIIVSYHDKHIKILSPGHIISISLLLN
jgi:hypothetical protein